MIPDYDLKSDPILIPYYKYHGDINVTSNIFNLQISFFWRALITNDTVNMIRKWTIEKTDSPYFILLGIMY